MEWKGEFNSSVKSFDSDQPARIAQADLNRNFFAIALFSSCKKTRVPKISVPC